MNDYKEQIWPYLHNELSAEERQRFEQALLADPALREALEECRGMHQDLESFGDRLLEEHLLAEWESEHPEYQEQQPGSRKKIIRFTIPLAAAAAAVFLLLALPIHQGPVDWQRTVYGPAPQLRGQAEGQPHYSPADLKQVNNDLQKAIETGIAQLPQPPETWKLQVHLQELANGYLTVEVSGYSFDRPDEHKVWQDTFHGLEHFNAEVPVFAKRIAVDLAKQNLP